MLGWRKGQKSKTRQKVLEDRVKSLVGLSAHLKEQRNNALELLLRHNFGLPLMEYLCSNGIIKEPFLFLDKKGIVLFYTPKLKEILGLVEDFQGKDYVGLLGAPKDAEEKVRRYLLSEEKLELRYTAQVNKKTREFLLKKYSPYKTNLDFSGLGLVRHLNEVQMIPIEVTLSGYFSNRKTPRLSKLLGLSSPESMAVIYQDLLSRGESQDEFLAYESRHGELALVERWLMSRAP